MNAAQVVAAISILVILFVLAYGLLIFGIAGPPAQTGIRKLGGSYIKYMLNDNKTYYNAGSPQGVGAILWDYRGLDTLYETMVLFTAIIGALMVYREYMGKKTTSRVLLAPSLSIIVQAVSRIILWLTIVLSLAIGFTGQLTPGGGFIGGTIFAVIPILVLLVYNRELLEKIGFTVNKALLLRTLSLLVLVLLVITPFFLGGYVFQNLEKPGSTFSYPERFTDNTPLGGIIFFLNDAELFAVAGAFSVAFVILGYIIMQDIREVVEE